MGLSVEDMGPVLLSKEDVDINAKTYEWLIDFVAANSIHFDGENGKTEIWGEVDDNYIYFNKTIFDRELKAHGLDSKSFLSWADRTGILWRDREHRTRLKRLSGTKPVTRCVVIKVPNLKESDSNPPVSDVSELPF